MSEPPRPDPGRMPASQLRRVIQACERYEADWRAGREPRIEEYLGQVAEPERAALLHELVALDLELRQRRGEHPDPQEYRRYFSGRSELTGSDGSTKSVDSPGRSNVKETPLPTPGVCQPLPADPPTDQVPDNTHRELFARLEDRPACPPTDRVSDHTPLAPGERLDDYEVVAPLGGGGMGQVYRVRHRRLDREFALKVIASHRISTDAIQRFEREMKAAGRTSHPNVILATDAGESRGLHYLVMELVPGTDLARLVKRSDPLPVADACEVIRQAALGLQAIHEAGLVHRDIKPSNLMLTPDGSVKVLDLGLARLVVEAGETFTQDGSLGGTADYIAPEQARDLHSARITADLYSLGCTLYCLLAGHPPFDDGRFPSLASKLIAHREEPVPPIATLRPGLARQPELLRLLDRLLAKEPADRPSEPRAVAEALAPLALGHDLPELFGDPADAGGDGAPTLEPIHTLGSSSSTARRLPLRLIMGSVPRTLKALFLRLSCLRRKYRHRRQNTRSTNHLAAQYRNRSGLPMTEKPKKSFIFSNIRSFVFSNLFSYYPMNEKPKRASLLVIFLGTMEMLIMISSVLYYEKYYKNQDRKYKQPLQIESLVVEDYRGDPAELLGTIGILAHAARFDDNVRVHARLTAPGYCYLIALNPDGKEQLCPKAAEHAPPGRTAEIVYPAEPDGYYGLTDGTGLQAFVLVASRKPLPPYTTWPARASLPWAPSNAAEAWQYDGRDYMPLGEIPLGPHRVGNERRVPTAPAPFAAVCRYLSQLPDVEAIRATAFPVLPAEELKPSPGPAPPRSTPVSLRK